ncbi:MAG TPA: insulinase family protein, partial [Myxococcales bacterium]|nr:insulinase family protein [Myxococcales bacterium]
VQKRGLTGEVEASLNALGSQFDIAGPTLLEISLVHDSDKTPEQILGVIDEEVEKLRAAPVDAATLARARVKMRSYYYGLLESTFGLGRDDLLACYALFDDQPARINDIDQEFAKVTPELMQKTAQEWLRRTNRTVIVLQPGGKP